MFLHCVRGCVTEEGIACDVDHVTGSTMSKNVAAKRRNVANAIQTLKPRISYAVLTEPLMYVKSR
jgi:hypothetical protein